MAVDASGNESQPAAPRSGRRRVRVGANVAVTIILAVAVVGVLQAIAYNLPAAKFDMTSTGVNSLSEGTIRLLNNLDQDITLTSLYFETDLEEREQPLYRRAVKDLLGLYESSARSKVRAEWINPLSDHEKLKELEARLRGKEKFKKELEPYVKAIEKYRSELDPKIRALLQREIDALGGLTGPMSNGDAGAAVGQIESLFQRWTQELDASREQIDALMSDVSPQHTAAVAVLKTMYRDVSKMLKDVNQFGRAQVQRNPDLPDTVKNFLNGAGGRYADLVTALEGETTTLQALEPLSIDDLLRQLQPNANPIIVETDQDALVVDFSSVWPPIDRNKGGAARFKDRAFKGEEKVTSAILRVTHKEQTAVVFVRYGGPPLFMGGFMPGQPPAPYAQMKKQLEDANFVVKEWDVKADESMPAIEPAPTRTIFVVLKPTDPQRGPMGRPSQEPPFSDAQRKAVVDAIGDKGRALFIAGWFPGPFGPIPATYDYGQYLKETWGITLDSRLLIETINTAPGKYGVGRRDFFNMNDLEVTDHPIVSGPQSRVLALPWCAPLEIADALPEGVKVEPLVIQPKRDGVWAIKNIQEYQKQVDTEGFMHLAPGDSEGPFTLAVAAEKGDAKIVVISGRDFALDSVAFAQALSMTAQGRLSVRSRNPGNVALLVNSLHWLNDNTDFMNVGQPIDTAVLEVKSPSTVKAVQVLTIFVWPALALACGCVAWWVRRR